MSLRLYPPNLELDPDEKLLPREGLDVNEEVFVEPLFPPSKPPKKSNVSLTPDTAPLNASPRFRPYVGKLDAMFKPLIRMLPYASTSCI